MRLRYVVVFFLLMGCGTLKDPDMVRTKVYGGDAVTFKDPDMVRTKVYDGDAREGKVLITLESKSDAQVSVELTPEGVTKLDVDNRGKTSWWESLLQYMLSKPDISVGDKN